MMAPPFSSDVNLDIEALSGICGSISIACWVVVFSPQIIENFRRRSAEGLSVVFIIVWLIGDLFNIIGALLQGVLPTMIILAVYYTFADLVLLCQVWWYRGFTLKDEPVESVVNNNNRNARQDEDSERQIFTNGANGHANGNIENRARRGSLATIQRHLSVADGSHLSPATPLLMDHKQNDPPAIANLNPQTGFQKVMINTFAVILVCAAGVFGWWLSAPHNQHDQDQDDLRGALPEFDTLGQAFGYLCAVFYLGSRIPQLVLNYRRKSTEGVSLLFFMFACIGNLTYDLSIFAYNPAPYCQNGPKSCMPGEQGRIYSRYIAVNASWIAGSMGTLFLDLSIFVQFFLYRKEEESEAVVVVDTSYGSVSRSENHRG